jgi:alpha-tubulin suppressor-like RCC1 family protein
MNLTRNSHAEPDSDENSTELIVWGLNNEGQLGIGENYIRETLTNPKICKFKVRIKDISCGDNHSLFLTFDYRVYSMGSNTYGQLGLGTPALTHKSSPHLIEGLSDNTIVKISSNGNYSIALNSNGAPFSWGENACGQLGISSYLNKDAPTEILLPKSQISRQNPKISEIDCGLRHFAMISEEFELLVCGNNKEGQLGIGTNNDSSRPVWNNLIEDPISQVSCGVSHTLV